MPQRTGRFPQAGRLRRSAEFQDVTRRGRRAPGDAFVVIAAERRGVAAARQGSRLGITVSRKVGHAVVRNRVKRRVREWFRVHRNTLGEQLDWVVIGRAPAGQLTREAAEAELSRLSQLAMRSGGLTGAA